MSMYKTLSELFAKLEEEHQRKKNALTAAGFDNRMVAFEDTLKSMLSSFGPLVVQQVTSQIEKTIDQKVTETVSSVMSAYLTDNPSVVTPQSPAVPLNKDGVVVITGMLGNIMKELDTGFKTVAEAAERHTGTLKAQASSIAVNSNTGKLESTLRDVAKNVYDERLNAGERYDVIRSDLANTEERLREGLADLRNELLKKFGSNPSEAPTAEWLVDNVDELARFVDAVSAYKNGADGVDRSHAVIKLMLSLTEYDKFTMKDCHRILMEKAASWGLATATPKSQAEAAGDAAEDYVQEHDGERHTTTTGKGDFAVLPEAAGNTLPAQADENTAEGDHEWNPGQDPALEQSPENDALADTGAEVETEQVTPPPSSSETVAEEAAGAVAGEDLVGRNDATESSEELKDEQAIAEEAGNLNVVGPLDDESAAAGETAQESSDEPAPISTADTTETTSENTGDEEDSQSENAPEAAGAAFPTGDAEASSEVTADTPTASEQEADSPTQSVVEPASNGSADDAATGSTESPTEPVEAAGSASTETDGPVAPEKKGALKLGQKSLTPEQIAKREEREAKKKAEKEARRAIQEANRKKGDERVAAGLPRKPTKAEKAAAKAAKAAEQAAGVETH